jgi:hypothetical protein
MAAFGVVMIFTKQSVTCIFIQPANMDRNSEYQGTTIYMMLKNQHEISDSDDPKNGAKHILINTLQTTCKTESISAK